MQSRRTGLRVFGVALLVISATVAVVVPRHVEALTKPCTLAGFEEAVFSTGGEFSFACASDTTLNISAGYGLNNVPANGSITLDGGNRLTLKSSGASFLFSLDNPPGNRSLILKNLTIDGFVQGTQNGSVVLVGPTNSLTVDNVTFRNNAATNGRKGGVIYARGPVTVTNSTFINNRSEGAPDAGGGAIVVDQLARSLSISNSTFISNTAPMGGAISTTITTTIAASTFISNTATRVPALGQDIESVGGAITLGDDFDFAFVVAGSLFRENRAVANAVLNIPAGGSGQARGGAIYHGLSGSGTMTITNSSFVSNTATAAGAFSTAPGTGRAEGGAVANRAFGMPLVISATTFVGNVAYGEGANQNPAGSGGAEGNASGGAIFSYSSQTRITNSTLALNQANGVSLGAGNSPTANGNGRGGAILLGGAATAILTYTTIYSNSVSFNGTSGVGEGAGIHLDGGSASAQVRGAIIAKNTLKTSPVQNCFGTTISSGGYNLSDVPGCNFTGTGDVQSAANPNLGPPSNNGGPSIGSSASPGVLLTMLPGSGSPAIDTGGTSANGCPSVDQRGATRPAGPQCDKGAVEVGGALPVTPTPTPPVSTPRVRVPVTWVNRPADATLAGGW